MKLKFGGQLIEPDVRRLHDLREVAFDTPWFETAADRDAYFMYRDLSLTPTDAETITHHKLRYDITIIPPFNMGLEFVKTYGHHHPRVNPKLRYTYPEVYEVLDGDAHYLLQRARNEESVDEVILVKATRGDKVIVPPNYGHVTVNPSERTLKMANWVCRSFESLYEPYAKLRGAAYYELINGRLLHNRAYHDVAEIRVAYPVEVPDYGLVKRKPMYELIEEPYLLEFLTAPERHTALFQELY
ncbi:MAG: glucose-6-phosphate isomerase family protein [Halobacteriota archaeon]|jgi:glucose-6-phosphate isomerase